MTWYENLFGILAVLDCIFITFVAVMMILSSQISRKEEKDAGW